MKFKLLEDVLNEERGDTSLRQALEILAKHLGLIEENDNRVWALHHLNGEHPNNEMGNLALMQKNRHISYHTKLRNSKISIDSKNAMDILQNQYSNDVIYIGQALLDALNSAAGKEEKELQQKINGKTSSNKVD